MNKGRFNRVKLTVETVKYEKVNNTTVLSTRPAYATVFLPYYFLTVLFLKNGFISPPI